MLRPSRDVEESQTEGCCWDVRHPSFPNTSNGGKTIRYALLIAVAGVIGFSAGKAHDHVRRTTWGWVWELEPTPDWPGVKPSAQLVECPDGKYTLPPWHVRVLWSDDAPISRVFWQERGR